MRKITEIGGYMGLEQNAGRMLHEDALALNCARNCLAYLIEARRIQKIKLPYFLCDSVGKVCEKHEIEIRYYYINEKLQPMDLCCYEDEWAYVVNYYGQLNQEQIRAYKGGFFGRLIVDNVQAYFDEPVDGVDTLYSCRKFFGVPDGAFLYTDAKLGRELGRDVSCERMGHILGRFDTSASEHYERYVANEQVMENLTLRFMSKLTENLLRGIDYEQAKAQRTLNYEYLARHLGKVNRLRLHPVQGAFAYPLWVRDGAALRKQLIANKVYVPMLWPNVLRGGATKDSLAADLAENILPLPCDQRYGEAEMDFICENVIKMMVLENNE